MLNFLILSLTSCSCNGREHITKSGEITQRTTKRCNSGASRYLSFFQTKPSWRKKYKKSQVNKSLPFFGKCRLRAATFQKLTTRALGIEIRTRKQKFFSKSRVFWISFVENSTERFFAQPEVHMNIEEMLRVLRRHTREAIFQMMRVGVSYRTGQN